MVRGARLVAARASAGAAGQGPRRPLRAADRADRRRQDAGGISADAGGAERSPLPPCGGAVGGERAQRRSDVISTGRGVQRSRGLHTLYISPLKALAVDIARNLETPIARDGPADQGRDPHRRYAGVAAPAAAALSAGHPAHHAGTTGAAAVVRRRAVSVLVAEAHRARRTACAGDFQARRSAVARAGAAVAAGAAACARSACRPRSPSRNRWRAFWCRSATARSRPPTSSSPAARRRRWSRCSTPRSACPGPATRARHALGEIYDLIKRNKTTLVFVNTRSQAEMLFQDLWRINDDNLPIALHHGSLDVAQRRKVEDAMAAGKLRGVVCTSSLDLGIDWGDVDLVINVGAPKGAVAADAAHRPRQSPPRRASRARAGAGQPLRGAGMPRPRSTRSRTNAQDTPPLRTGALDVLAQHVLGCACGEPFAADELYRRSADAPRPMPT